MWTRRMGGNKGETDTGGLLRGRRMAGVLRGYKVLGGMRDLVPYDRGTSQHLIAQDC